MDLNLARAAKRLSENKDWQTVVQHLLDTRRDQAMAVDAKDVDALVRAHIAYDAVVELVAEVQILKGEVKDNG